MNHALTTLFLIGSTLVACGGKHEQPNQDGSTGSPPNAEAGLGSAPKFLSFGLDRTSITENQTVTFTAVLTDPDGIDDLIGGSLKSPDASITYGAFQTSGQEGSYSLQLSWTTLHQIQPINFTGMEQRQFVAEFFDVAGHKSTQETTLRLQCDAAGGSACNGRCTDVATDKINCGACGNNCNVASGGFGLCEKSQCLLTLFVQTRASCNAVCADSPNPTKYECAAACSSELRMGQTTLTPGGGTLGGLTTYQGQIISREPIADCTAVPSQNVPLGTYSSQDCCCAVKF